MRPLLIPVLEQAYFPDLLNSKNQKISKSLGLLAVFDESAVLDQQVSFHPPHPERDFYST
jgi:hypothetical protein